MFWPVVQASSAAHSDWRSLAVDDGASPEWISRAVVTDNSVFWANARMFTLANMATDKSCPGRLSIDPVTDRTAVK